MPTDDQISKLPLWARNHINTLSADLKSAAEQIAALDSSESRITWSVGLTDHGLPDRAHIEFKTSGGTVEIALRNGVLKIHGEDGLIVEPESGNSLTIKGKRASREETETSHPA